MRIRKLRVYSRPSMAFLLALSMYANVLALRLPSSSRSLSAKRHSTIEEPSHKPAPASKLSSNTSGVSSETKKQISETYGRLPLSFEANRGQTDPQVKFLSRGNGYSLFLTPEDAVIVLMPPSSEKQNYGKSEAATSSVLRMSLVGSNRRAKISGLKKLAGKTNYFIGNDRSKWQTDVPSYSKVKYESVYPGVDMVYYGNQQQLEYDFVVAPGADPNRIKLLFEGMSDLHLDESGDLVLTADGRELRQHKPFVYQVIDGKRREILSRYEITGKHVTFELGRYDRSKTLVIDPVISYSTFLGGPQGYDFGYGIAVDASGNAYIAGETGSPFFPVRNSLQSFGGQAGIRGDAFITKLNATGTQLLFSTYYGGASIDVAEDIALDAAGNVYVTGWTSSESFPVTAGAFRTTGGANGNTEAFAVKLNSTGSTIMYSTYIPAREDDYGQGIVVDSAGNAVITGRTNSDNFPTRNALQPTFGGGTCGSSRDACFDAFVTKLNATGSDLVYSTYLGGSDEDRPNWDSSGGIAIDSLGAVYVTGHTRSTNFPVVNAYQATHAPGGANGDPEVLNSDVYVTKFDPSGQSLVYSTYIGGPGEDTGQQIVVDSQGFAYVMGAGNGVTGFPITPGAYLASGITFVIKLSVAGNELVYSTNVDMDAYGLAIDSVGNAYLTGEKFMFSGFRPANVSKINSSGTALIFSFNIATSQWGGESGSQRGRDIALDSAGNMYVTGDTFNGNLPTTSGAPQPNFSGQICGINVCSDGFVLKLADVSGHTISGRVTDSAGNSLSGVKMALSGGLKIAVVTNSSGTYSFSDLMPNRTYTVTPTKEFFNFTPVSRTFSALSSDQTTADFVGSIPNVSISGSVSNATSGIGGVTVTLSGSQSQTTQTNAVGSYSFPSVPSGGTYTVTPSRGSDVFDPSSKTFTNVANHQTANFKLVYQVSGQVTDAAGAPAPAVTITLSGSKTGVTKTDDNGNYSFLNLPANGNYTLTPSKASVLVHTFTPPAQTLSNLSANQVANFSFTTSTGVALFPLADAYVQDGTTANTNFGSATPMLLKTSNQSGQKRDVYLKFDVSTVSHSITGAKLRFTAALSESGAINTAAYAVVDTTWLESDPGGINWNNKPVRSGTALASVAVSTTTYANYDLDITGYIVGEKAAGREVISLALHNPSNSSNHITLHSREGATNKPQLVLTTTSTSNAAPTVSVLSPSGGASYIAAASVPLSATASDSDGGISKVDYYAGTNLIGTATTSPYNATWANVGAGSYTITAVATDNQGLTTASSGVPITVNNLNLPPVVNLTAPTSNATFAAGSNITVSATASDVDGSVTQVEFLSGTTSLGIDTIAPYSISWNNAVPGAHSLTARAMDNQGALTNSAAVSVNVVWQTGFSAVHDAYVKDGSTASTNFGTATELQVQQGASGSNRESYLRFDLTAVNGVARAKLRVFGRLSDTSGTNVSVGVYAMSSPASTQWVESGSGSITWNNKPASGTLTLLGTTTVTDNGARWYEFDVSSHIQAEKTAGRSVVSFALKSQAASNPFVIFNAREATTNRPQLLVWATQARAALFAVGSSNLNAGDTAVKTRLESLGFTVTVKVANNNLITVDADGKALVVISSTCTAGNVNTKFRHVVVPVVSWEFDVHDDLGMTGTAVNTDFGTSAGGQTNVSITNAGHALAAGLSGSVPVVNNGASFSFSWGVVNANAAKIATLLSDANKAVIFGYESGASMPGLEAAARRVGLFMTDLTAGSLNGNGNALFEAAVRWATEVNPGPAINLLTPASGPVGTVVTISGLNFGLTQGSSTLSFNGVPASALNWSDKTIVTAVPLYASPGMVVVKVNGISSNGLVFTVAELDSDGDGLADWWEMQYFGNLNQTAAGDPDGDGISNLQEYQQGRNPTVNALLDDAAIDLKVFRPLASPSP